MRLIDADALAESIEQCRSKHSIFAQFARAYAKDAPTIDAVPVVRCKECKRWDEVTQVCDKFSNPHCAHLTGATGFCKWSERKDKR